MSAPADVEPGFSLRRFLLSGDGWPYLLVPFIPLAIVLEVVHAGATPVFLAAALGVIPTAALMGRSTEELAARSGPGIGGFLNVTFGNFLLVMGAAMLAGGLGRDRQRFDRTAANVQSLMLLLAAVALVMPAIFELVAGAGLPRPTDKAVDFPGDLEQLSVGVSVVLLITYAAGLVFSLKTHRDLFNPSHAAEDHGGEPWSIRRAVTMLAVAGVAVGVMSEILVGSITEASANLGLSPFFVGIIVVAVVS